MKNSYDDIYRGRKVLITGHTGFKGSWLTLWLKELGATVVGYSLDPPSMPNLFSSCSLQNKCGHIHGDIRDFDFLERTIQEEKPEIIFHLAAQSLVLESYKNPMSTFHTNTQGTVNVLEAGIRCDSVQAMVMVTTDKVYENVEQIWGYREIDRLGGDDPYSASKGMAEIAIHSYKKSFMKSLNRKLGIASARAGNVIGGGDFSENRLIPDAMRSLMNNEPIQIRNPTSVRPWLHVLEPLHGYLLLGSNLLTNPEKFSEAWNFAPLDNYGVTCRSIIEKTIELWGKGDWIHQADAPFSEKKMLRLNGEKAAEVLDWNPRFNWIQALELTVDWYKMFYENRDMYKICVDQINYYLCQNNLLDLKVT